MIDRREVEALLAMLEQVHKPNNGTLAELCRSYLAVLDAPVVQIGGADGLSAFLSQPGKQSLPNMQGQRVRLVRVQEG